MDCQYGKSVRARRWALDVTQIELAFAVGHSQGWVWRLENLHCIASAADKRRIEAFLAARERPRRNAERAAR